MYFLKDDNRNGYLTWLQALKMGDSVVVAGGSFSVYVIDSETPTQFKAGPGLRFRKSDGKVIGRDFRRVEPMTDHHRNRIARDVAVRQIRDAAGRWDTWDGVGTATLERMAALLKEQ